EEVLAIDQGDLEGRASGERLLEAQGRVDTPEAPSEDHDSRARLSVHNHIHHLAAVTMISTSIPGRHRLACTHARTGGLIRSIHAFQAALCASNSRMSASHTCALRSFDLSVPA